jgi:hypothetical protein|uniref:Uncharacterized protein n=1 Tax=Siphoviridae sp. ctNHj22 TaxID=2825468 RepID=A0A8S5VFQ5_9CAUD|nr:MAG TPA: hypothetical protein [Siphoviridae sp. ctNHj22]
MRLGRKSTKLLAASLCLAIAATCTGCKSSEVKNTENLINSIGDVTLSSGNAIDAASSAYADLGDQQSKVENAQTLQDAESAYSALITEHAAPIEDAINAIPQPVTAEAKEAVDNASKLYESASVDVKYAVSNTDVLTAAQKAMEDIVVQTAIEAINQIGDVSLNSQEAIDAATAAYQDVPSNRRADITNYNVLTEANGTINQLKREAAEAEGKAAVSKLKTKKDEVEGITWYEPSCYPKYSNSRCFVLPYIGERDGHYWLCCKVDYANSNWVFFTSIVINIDGEKRDTIEFDYSDVTRDAVVGGNLYEVADFVPGGTRLTLLSDIANSKKTIIRFQGSDYCYDFEVPEKDKQGIKDVLAAWDYFNS